MVKKMVCCKFFKLLETTVLYYYGVVPSDMSGMIEFNLDGSGFRIIQEPEEETVHLRSLNLLYRKYKGDFEKGIFKQKISFESH